MLDELNPPQREAVCTTRGPMLVLAGAGSGKTRVITFRIARLIQAGVRPERILAVTFTNKAAKEMKQRTSKLLGRRKNNAGAPEISTFHSLCVRILRRHGTLLGYPSEFAIFDGGDQDSIARSALRDIRVGVEKLRPSDLLWFISRWKSLGVRADNALAEAQNEKEQLAAMAYSRYQSSLRSQGAVDFDDLLLLTEQLFSEHAGARLAEQSRFEHLLIDEYQDTNGLQYRIVKTLADRHRNLCVVGDDDQSIYGWRGAEVSHILNFKNDWPEAKIVRLEDNYRSREAILDLANKLILHNSTRHQKVLKPRRPGGNPPRVVRFDDESKEAAAIVREIAQLVSQENQDRIKAGDIAILFRTNEQPRAFELELRRAKIPYVLVGGQSFYDRKEVRDALAYLKVLAQPNDEVSLLRIINTPARGISAGTVQSLVQKAVELGVPLWKVLSEHLPQVDLMPAAADRVAAFKRTIEHYRGRLGQGALGELMRDLLDKIDYRSELTKLYKNSGDVEARWNSIAELVNALALYEQRAEGTPTLAEFLEETALGGREDQRDEKDPRKEHAVTLMTLHSAKGLEFPHVYMVGMEEGLLPHQRSVLENRGVDEERRLCYVGVTRAMDELTLTLSKQRMKWGKVQHSIPSRFLLEMRGETERAQRAAEASLQMLRQGRGAEAAELANDGALSTAKSGATVTGRDGARSDGSSRDGTKPAKKKRKVSSPKTSARRP